jgi:hypothetical protein
VRLALPLRELEQRQRAVDVDVVSAEGRELGASREERRQVKDEVDLELSEQTIEQAGVGDGAG